MPLRAAVQRQLHVAGARLGASPIRKAGAHELSACGARHGARMHAHELVQPAHERPRRRFQLVLLLLLLLVRPCQIRKVVPETARPRLEADIHGPRVCVPK